MKFITDLEEILTCDLGVYRIFWKSGGSSVAAIGNHHSGRRWLAPANWTSPEGVNPGTILENYIDEIHVMERLDEKIFDSL